MAGKLDPRQFNGFLMGPIASRPAAGSTAEMTLFFPTDETAVYQVQSGGWVKIADLTGNIPWEDITNKPSEFNPSKHDLEADHDGFLHIRRVLGHDINSHTGMISLAMANEPI